MMDLERLALALIDRASAYRLTERQQEYLRAALRGDGPYAASLVGRCGGMNGGHCLFARWAIVQQIGRSHTLQQCETCGAEFRLDSGD